MYCKCERVMLLNLDRDNYLTVLPNQLYLGYFVVQCLLELRGYTWTSQLKQDFKSRQWESALFREESHIVLVRQEANRTETVFKIQKCDSIRKKNTFIFVLLPLR